MGHYAAEMDPEGRYARGRLPWAPPRPEPVAEPVDKTPIYDWPIRLGDFDGGTWRLVECGYRFHLGPPKWDRARLAARKQHRARLLDYANRLSVALTRLRRTGEVGEVLAVLRLPNPAVEPLGPSYDDWHWLQEYAKSSGYDYVGTGMTRDPWRRRLFCLGERAEDVGRTFRSIQDRQHCASGPAFEAWARQLVEPVVVSHGTWYRRAGD